MNFIDKMKNRRSFCKEMARICKFGEDIFQEESMFLYWGFSTQNMLEQSSLNDEQKIYLNRYIRNVNLILNEFIKNKKEFKKLSYFPFWYNDNEYRARANKLYLIIFFIIDDKRLESIYKRNSGLLHYFPLKSQLYISLVMKKYLDNEKLSLSELAFYDSFWDDMEKRRSEKWDH